MATTETTLNKPAEHSDLLEQQVADVTDNNGSKSDTPTAAQKDAADILAILDSFGAQQPITDQLPKDAPLTAEEQDKLADLLGDTKLKSDTENKDEQTDLLQVEVTENHGDLDKVKNKTSFAKQEQNKLGSLLTETRSQFEVVTAEHDTLGKEIDGLLTNIQTQLEAVIVEHDTLSKELVLTRARVKELENNQPDNKAEKENRTRNNEDIEHLRSELTKITTWHESLTTQVQKLLKLAENSNAEREILEADLTQAHETICNLHKKEQLLQEKLEDCDNMVTDLHTQFVDQTAMLTTTHEKLQHEVSQRRKAEQMLRKIKSRFAPLTRTKSTTQSISNPIAKLKAATAHTGAGKLDTQIEVNLNDEIGGLARSFNKMAKDLESTTASVEQLQQTKKELQKTVKELEQFNRLAVGRELQMIELKKETNALLGELGRKQKYKSDFDETQNKCLTSNVD